MNYEADTYLLRNGINPQNIYDQDYSSQQKLNDYDDWLSHNGENMMKYYPINTDKKQIQTDRQNLLSNLTFIKSGAANFFNNMIKKD